MAKYTPQKIEKKWQQYWEKENSFATADKSKKPKYYCLVEFPYPSGDGLHVGHPRPYTALDILARKRRMQGYNVLYPMGFDAFGLPTENYAIKTGQQPADITKKNIVTFTQQLKSLGLSFDWQRQVVTSDPTYYRWTQWIFLKLFEHGLAYKDTISINWCPSCKIGLANEEVVNGNCERCGTAVEKRQKAQWLLKITRYADRLIQDLSTVEYADRIKLQQVNWIGRSEGAEVDFTIDGLDKKITVYTTRPDTLFGATFMVLSPEHQLIKEIAAPAEAAAVEAYQNQAASKTDLERTNLNQQKTGVFTGAYAINPMTGKKIPIWIADYVLSSYGTGAIMAVPAHDQRDWEFATKFKLPIVPVISGGDISKAAHEEITSGKLINSQQFNGLSVAQGSLEIIGYLTEHQLGKKAVNYKLRDWVFSRQRYWGEPIPLVFCQSCAERIKNQETRIKRQEFSKGELENPGWVAVPEKKLPVTLPAVTKYEPTESGESPLSAITDWVDTTCPRCKGPAKRETDTMPNWAGSNWYFLRYIDPKNTKAFADKKKLAHWLPVDWYNGGMEHTTLHLLYSRFIYKFLYDIDVVPKEHGVEPYAKRTSHGLILGEGGEKMSKSKGNVINPNDIVSVYGADTLRLYEMFMGPFDQAIPWDTKGVKGVRRFLEKVWDMYENSKLEIRNSKSEDKTIVTLLHKTIKKVSEDIETQDYNTAVSAMMIFVNAVNQHGGMSKKTAEAFLKILAPFAPHLAEELWQQLGHRQSIAKESWPVFDASLIAAESITLVIQVNGKVRDSLNVSADITQQMAESTARQREKIQPHLENKKIQNVIFVPGRLINFVTE